MISLVWAALAAIIAIGLEILYRQSSNFPVLAIIPAIILTFCIYKTMFYSETLLLGVAAFSMFTLLMRIAASVIILNEPLVKGNLVVAGLLLTAQVVGRLWR